MSPLADGVASATLQLTKASLRSMGCFLGGLRIGVLLPTAYHGKGWLRGCILLAREERGIGRRRSPKSLPTLRTCDLLLDIFEWKAFFVAFRPKTVLRRGFCGFSIVIFISIVTVLKQQRRRRLEESRPAGQAPEPSALGPERAKAIAVGATCVSARHHARLSPRARTPLPSYPSLGAPLAAALTRPRCIRVCCRRWAPPKVLVSRASSRPPLGGPRTLASRFASVHFACVRPRHHCTEL